MFIYLHTPDSTYIETPSENMTPKPHDKDIYLGVRTVIPVLILNVGEYIVYNIGISVLERVYRKGKDVL